MKVKSNQKAEDSKKRSLWNDMDIDKKKVLMIIKKNNKQQVRQQDVSKIPKLAFDPMEISELKT
jgi:hypothetical protein